MALLPLYVAAWEIECCRPDLTVGEVWDASPVLLRGDVDPLISGPIDSSGSPLGVIETVVTPHTSSLPGGGVAELAGVIVATEQPVTSPTRGRWRLLNDHHGVDPSLGKACGSVPVQPEEGPRYPPIVSGRVVDLYGMKFEYRKKKGMNLWVPVAQTVTALTTSALEGDHEFHTYDRFYNQFLAILEVAPQHVAAE